MNVQRFTASLLSKILDARLCPGCRHPLDARQHFCGACESRLITVTNPCRLCGLESRSGEPVCATCLYDPPRWQKMLAPWQYRDLVRELLLQLKFSESLYLANCLTGSATRHFIDSDCHPEVLIPVPLHDNRLLERGFNQAFEIARLLSMKLDIPLDRQVLKRIKDTSAQAGLSANQREKNILRAFSCDPVSYRHVAVVDDIITTGSTCNEIAKTLHRAGVETVEIWGLARVVKY